MDKAITVLQVIFPIFTAIVLGILARRKQLLTKDEIQGFQKFVMKFGLPCVVFNSCLTANIGVESLTSMGLVASLILLGTFWAFHARKKQFPYHNFPSCLRRRKRVCWVFPCLLSSSARIRPTGWAFWILPRQWRLSL